MKFKIYSSFRKWIYKFSQNSRHKVWPWLVWSIIYVLIGVSCGIYELCLGGTVLEVTLVPIAYLAIFSLWSYAIWSVFDYFKSMKVSATADTVSPDGEFYSKALFLIGITRHRGLILVLYELEFQECLSFPLDRPKIKY